MILSSAILCVVDDDPSVCTALGRLLKSAGFRARTYGSARAFLDAERSGMPDVLILDLRMPDMDGLGLQAYLTASGRAPPIVFITAHEDEIARKKAMASGAVAFFQKPFDEKNLLAVICRVLHLPAR